MKNERPEYEAGRNAEYIEGEGLSLAPDVKSPKPGETFPADKREHVFRVEAMPVEKKTYETSEGVPIVLISGDNDNISGLNEIVKAGNDPRSRGEYLKQEIFLKSPSVRVFLPQEMGGHAVSILRAQEVADVSIHSIGSMRKTQEMI